MKSLLVLLLLALTTSNSICQNPQLFQNTWYLTKVVMNETEYIFPYGSLSPELYFQNEFIQVVHPYCEDGFSAEIEYVESTNFMNQNGGVSLLGTCGNPDDLAMANAHYSIYLEVDNYTAKNPFFYELITESQSTTLVITNGYGDKAYYGDAELRTQQLNQIRLVVYPNPVHETLQISNYNSDQVRTIEIFNSTGSLLLFIQDPAEIRSVDVLSLVAGAYFIKLHLSNGDMFVQKFIKI